MAVATFLLRRAFRPDLWDEAVGELDVVARDLAESLRRWRSCRTAATRTSPAVALASTRSGTSEAAFRSSSAVFLFDGRREYQLTCRIDERNPERGESACAELLSFSV